VTCLITLATGSLAAGPVAVDDLDGLVAHALTDHPALVAAAAETRASLAGERAAGSPPDPVLRWGEMLEPVETRVGPQQRVLSLQQSLPWPGTLSARKESAAALTGAMAANEGDLRLRIAADVKRAWAGAAWLTAMRELAGRQIELVAALERSLRAAYESGEGSYADLLQVQLERVRLEDRRDGLDDEVPATLARLNAALGRDPAAPLDLPAALTDLPAGLGQASELHPRLAELDQRQLAADHQARAAARGGRPSFTVGVDWIQVDDPGRDGLEDAGKDAWVARLGVTLPIWRGKHDGPRLAAEARAAALGSHRQAQSQQLAARMVAARADWRDATRRHDRHRDDLIPRARQAYESALAAYRAAAAPLADVLAAERTLLALEESLLSARRDAWLASADLDEAAGILPAVETINPRREP
jgi:outer membrane protein TolC